MALYLALVFFFFFFVRPGICIYTLNSCIFRSSLLKVHLIMTKKHRCVMHAFGSEDSIVMRRSLKNITADLEPRLQVQLGKGLLKKKTKRERREIIFWRPSPYIFAFQKHLVSARI